MRGLLSVYAALAFLFLHLPLLVLAIFSVNSSRFTVWQGFSLRWYRAMIQDEQLLEALRTSLLIAIPATAVATAAGTLCAYALWKRRARFISGGLFLSLATPEIVMGVSLLAFFQWIFRYFHVQLGMHTVVMAHVMFSLAFVVAVVSSRLQTFDRGLEEAALDLGADDWQAFRLVTLPALWPGIAAAALLAFTISFDDYVITSMVAGVDSETLPMVVYAMARRGANPVVNAVSTLMVVGLGAFIVIAERLRAT